MKIFRVNVNSFLTFSKHEESEKLFNFIYGVIITLIRINIHTWKKNYRTISLMNFGPQILNIKIAKWMQENHERVICKWIFALGYKNGSKYKNESKRYTAITTWRKSFDHVNRRNKSIWKNSKLHRKISQSSRNRRKKIFLNIKSHL